jgi:GNAT superfamily N-acetyltransferase
VSGQTPEVIIRNTLPEDFDRIIELTRAVYPDSPTWQTPQLASHLEKFPQGQFVAVEPREGRLVGMAASLIILWDDYEYDFNWREFTAHGSFSNHDPVNGRTLYGAEVMVHPAMQGRGVGKSLYGARRKLAERLGLLRIRAGARLRGYHRYADRLSPEDYVIAVVRREIGDPTLSFQLKQGFHVLKLVPGYLRHDPESLGHAAVIEWLNPLVAKPEDYARRKVLGEELLGP